jgi:hypothetical protein
VTIQFPEPPKEVAKAIEQVPRPGPRWTRPLRLLRELGGAPAGESLPAQPIFTVDLTELLRAGDAEQTITRSPTWRYSRFDAGGNAEVLELGGRAEQGPVATGDDRFSSSIREALAVADQDPRVQAHDYEARLFRVPALTLLALWLHAANQVDLFVPVGRMVAGLEQRVYEDGDFMNALREAGQRTLTAYEEAENPEELGS